VTHIANKVRIVYALIAGCVCAVCFSAAPTIAQELFEFTSYKDIEALFAEKGYTSEAWEAGIREVPRLYMTNVPSRWRDKYAQEVIVQTKKNVFFRVLGPLTLRVNEVIAEDRARLESLARKVESGERVSAEERDWLNQLAKHYKVLEQPSDDLASIDFAKLMARVDVVPPSLALSQSAEESGWGTSRFADLGNALFGQWTWGEGIKPKKQRGEHGDHRIAAFESPLLSMMAYAMNLNTHSAYADYREKRAAMRRAKERLSGYELASTLINYSERGQAYVDSLRQIMRVNKLDPTDDAYLTDEPPIYMMPVGAGAD
jgi:uncharacterized FlgJ-related protein